MREYTIIALTAQKLVEDNYRIYDISGKQIKITKDDHLFGYFTEPEFKKWILEKAEDY